MPISSPIADVDIPLKDIATFFFEQAEARIDAIASSGAQEPAALVDGKTNSSLRFSDIKGMALRIARGLNTRHADEYPEELGDVAAVFSPADIRLSAIHFGTLMAGGTYMALDPSLEAPVLAQRLVDVNTKAVFVAAELVPALIDACKQSGAAIPKQSIILLRGSYPGYSTLDDLLVEPDAGEAFTPQVLAGEETLRKVALVVYSSGTTGVSKGIMLTHHNVIAMYTMVGGYSARSKVHDVHYPGAGAAQSHILSALPLWLLYGHCVLCYQPLTTGDCVVQLPVLDLDDYLGAIDRYSVNRLSAAPHVLHRLLRETTKAGAGSVVITAHPSREYNISSVKAVGCGGASLPPHLIKVYSEYFDGAPIIQGYGATESSSIIAGSSWTKPVAGAVGVLYPNTKAKVVDENGQETSGFGQLCIHGPHVMRGYTSRAVQSPVVDGYLHTGDYARLTPDGHVFLKGRVVDVVHTADGPVSPTDIECQMVEHPDVKDCAVVGVGPRGSARPVAFVILTQESTSSLSDVEKWIQERTGIAVECRETQMIPKSPAGKVLRYLLLR
ncbi:acetyl-CoA synthetase-like protein [Martensiomyces pterosporus]|nr:acetyl-CoA synthetase-like protein [Martensiomyces pterosporus]